jgi:hypothetical protein
LRIALGEGSHGSVLSGNYSLNRITSKWKLTVSVPNLVRAVDHQITQQIWPDIMPWMLFTGVGFLINRNQTHKARQPPDTMTATLVFIALHVTSHLA